MKNFFEASRNGMEEKSQLSPLQLAYIGDGVYELLVRSKMLASSPGSVDKINRQARNYVRAAAQSASYHRLLAYLTEEEAAVMKRGRNAKSYSRAKNASVSDYRHATGVEALFGYLYVTGKNERIMELFKICGENPPQE